MKISQDLCPNVKEVAVLKFAFTIYTAFELAAAYFLFASPRLLVETS